MHTSEPAHRLPPRKRFDARTNNNDSSSHYRAQLYDRALRNTSSIGNINNNSNHFEEEEEEEVENERRRPTTTTTTNDRNNNNLHSDDSNNNQFRVKASKLEIELERLQALLRVCKKDFKDMKREEAKLKQTVQHERRRTEEYMTTNERMQKEQDELRALLEISERERDQLKIDFVDLGERATVTSKQNEYVKKEYEKFKSEMERAKEKEKEESLYAKKCLDELKTAEKRIRDEFVEERKMLEKRAEKWRDEVLEKVKSAKKVLEKREKNVKRKENEQSEIERKERQKYEAKLAKMRVEFEQKTIEIEREANERGAAAVARFGARASETEIAAVTEAQFAKEKMGEAMKEAAVAKTDRDSFERKCKDTERAMKESRDALEKETFTRIKYQAELEVLKIQSGPIKEEMNNEKEMKDDYKKRLEMSLRKIVDLQAAIETLSNEKKELLESELKLKSENERLNDLIKQTVEEHREKIEQIKIEIQENAKITFKAVSEDAKRAIETCYEESAVLKRQVNELQEKIESETELSQSIVNERDVAMESLENTMKELESKTEQIDELKENLEHARDVTNQISARMQSLVTDYEDMQSDLETAALKINELTVENLRLLSAPDSASVGVNTSGENIDALKKRMETEKEIEISIETERVREKLQSLFESRSKALTQQNQSLIEVLQVMRAKIDASETNFNEEFSKRRKLEAEVFAKTKEIDSLERKVRVFEDLITKNHDDDDDEPEAFFTPGYNNITTTTTNNNNSLNATSNKRSAASTSTRNQTSKNVLSKRLGFNKTSPLMRPNHVAEERGLW